MTVVRMYITKDNGPYKKGTVVMMSLTEAIKASEWAKPMPGYETAVIHAREVR